MSHARNVWVEGAEEEAERYRGHRRAGPIAGYATITLLVRREAFARVGPLDEKLWFADSVDWFLRAKRAGVEIVLMDEVLVEHRMHGANLTLRAAERSEAEFLTLLRGQLAERRGDRG